MSQLVLGFDRNFELVAHVYDERNKAVKKWSRLVIETCNTKEKHIGIFGPAPLDDPELTNFVVECEISHPYSKDPNRKDGVGANQASWNV